MKCNKGNAKKKFEKKNQNESEYKKKTNQATLIQCFKKSNIPFKITFLYIRKTCLLMRCAYYS